MQIKRAIPPVALAVLLAACARKPRPPQDLSVTFFDVGQADAALIRTPENETIVVDAGHNSQIAELLRREGVASIDLVVLSNAHADHTGGLTAILDAFAVHEIWYSGLDYTREQRAVIERAERYEAVTAGAQKRFAKLTLDVLHPESLPLRPRDSSVNDHSLVLKATYPTARYLFPGDCEEQCWESLFRFHRSDLAADVLKAAYHGAETGTSLNVLASVRPKTLAISCGRGNEFGQPSPAVLDLAGQRHARVFRTDEQGTIHCLGTACQAGRR
jgi:beta-lactamase superfamily II metal-dependent hydrolase